MVQLRERPVAIEYPLVEGEIMHRRRAQVVTPSDAGAPGSRAFADVLAWGVHAVAPNRP
jgi:hypothetical protein